MCLVGLKKLKWIIFINERGSKYNLNQNTEEINKLKELLFNKNDSMTLDKVRKFILSENLKK